MAKSGEAGRMAVAGLAGRIAGAFGRTSAQEAGRMAVAGLAGLPPAARRFLESQGYVSLYPPQGDSVEAGLLDGESLLVSAPTASGKTLVAMMSIMAHLAAGRAGKAVYLSPLRALASEKFAELKKLEGVEGLLRKEKGMPRRPVKVRISTGDRGGSGSRLMDADVLVLTNERMDALMRNSPEWEDAVGLVVADEIHLVGDPTRGPTLETVLTKLRMAGGRPQLVGLSATVTNAAKIADWMGATLVSSRWRPVPLREGVYDGRTVWMAGGKSRDVKKTQRGAPVDLGADSVREGGQALLFAETRLRSASMAAKAAGAVSDMLDEGERKGLARASEKILGSGEGTEMVKTLAKLVADGVAFHHAGLDQACREVVESEFRAGRVKILASTPTLAAGVNLPARRVVVSSISRYDAAAGISMPISVLEYKQLCGRAGRPQYDRFGEAVIVAGSHDADEVAARYIRGRPEPVTSKITEERPMRVHLLGLVSSSDGISGAAATEFFMETLGGRQSTARSVSRSVDDTVGFLASSGMIRKGGGGLLAATPLGRKVSSLYMDPTTAVRFVHALRAASRGGKRHTLGFLNLLSQCDEFYPRLYMREQDHELMRDLLDGRRREMLDAPRRYGSPDYHGPNRSLLALNGWIEEAGELWMSQNLKVESGDMHRMAETADWLLRCLRELAGRPWGADAAAAVSMSDDFYDGDDDDDDADYGVDDALLAELDALRRRVAYGVKEDLLDLVRLRGVGRVRARRLRRAGFATLDDLAAAPQSRIAAVARIGPTIAASIKDQLIARRRS